MPHRSIRFSALIAAIVILYAATPAASTRAGERPKYVSDEVLVKLNPSVDVHTFAAANGLNPAPDAIDQLDSHPIYRLQIVDGTPPPRKAAALAHDLRVIYAE